MAERIAMREDTHEDVKVDSPLRIPGQQRRVVDDEIDTDFEATEVLEAQPEDTAALSERDLSILAFEKQAWRHAGAKEQAIKEKFGLSGTRYYQLLNALLDNPAAREHDPVLVGRLRRIRGSRARQRSR